MRILALDWGSVRVGAAVSDEDGKIAFPLDQAIESKNAVAEIKELVEKLGIEKIIFGLPKTLAGQEGRSAEELKIFADNISHAIKIPTEFVDERFTSVEATKRLHEQGIKEKNQRSIKDNIAAQIMLQQYLDSN